jgi:hypothetical protein
MWWTPSGRSSTPIGRSSRNWEDELFQFVANLKPYLLNPGRGRRRFDTYLLSPDYLAAGRALVTAAKRDGRLIAADNGNFDLIGDLVKRFAGEAALIHRDRIAEEQRLGHRARPGDLSIGLTERYRKLVRSVAAQGRSETPVARTRSTVGSQMQIGGDYLVGMEDLSMAAMIGLGIQPEYARLPASWYEASSKRALGLAERTRAGDFGDVGGFVFAGLHGLDYDTARRAGRLAGDVKAEGIASGLGGALGDPSYVDFRVEDGKTIPLASSVPRAYLRVAEVACGLHRGYADGAGARPRFHALGVGTPILLPLLSVLGDRGTFTAVDSTAPILDAWSSLTVSLYIDDPAPMKLKAHRIAEVWLSGGPSWSCSCSACSSFNSAHPPKITAARAWWRGEGRRALIAQDLRAPSPLADMLPLLGNPSDAAVSREAGMARIAHNHWALQRLVSAAQANSSSASRLKGWAEDVVSSYVESSADQNWREAVTEAWKLTESTAAKIRSAKPGGEVAA